MADWSFNKGMWCSIPLIISALACRPEKEPSPPRSPEEALTSFQLDKSLEIQLVAAEPLIQDPVFSVFDGAGRLWVVEMRGFMNDVDRAGEDEPLGRVSILLDQDGNGLMDSSIIYLDSLIMPRSVAPVSGGALLAENKALWMTSDLNGDLIADTKVLVDSLYAKNGLPEHSDNGLWRGLDNWYYSAKSTFRYRYHRQTWIKDSTEFRGQWGICHDDAGRLIYNYNWSQLHGDLIPPNYLNRNPHHQPTTGIDYGFTADRRIYPIRSNPAVNRGYIPGTLDAQGRLLEFTAACAPFYYRADALPADYYANVFVCEPSGNLIKRNVTRDSGLYVVAHDPNPGKEFLASTDERFRPVFIHSGPDGALYITDMYRGLIQHGAYVTPYLREQTLQRHLESPVHFGRIWRMVPKGWYPPPVVNLEKFSSLELIPYLSSPNGWIRDKTQQLMVERNEDVSDTLYALIANDQIPTLARVHALWTLEGLKKLDDQKLLNLMDDPALQVRTTALRLGETIAQENQAFSQNLAIKLTQTFSDAPIAYILQMALSLHTLPSQQKITLARQLFLAYAEEPLIRDALMSSLQNHEYQVLTRLLAEKAWNTYSSGKEISLEMFGHSVLKKSDPGDVLSLLNLLTTTKPDWQINALVNGMATAELTHPVGLSRAPALYRHLDTTSSLLVKLLHIKSKLFWPGYKPEQSTTGSGHFSLSDAERQSWSRGRKHYVNSCGGCHGNDGSGLARFAPTLRQSEWVVGNPKRLALLVLHGLEGPIKVGQKIYDTPEILPVMPSHSTLGDDVIADILTYIRNEWGNQSPPVTRRLVGMTRVMTQGRVTPWTAPELDEYIAKSDTTQIN